jgi:hypothetical protein
MLVQAGRRSSGVAGVQLRVSSLRAAAPPRPHATGADALMHATRRRWTSTRAPSQRASCMCQCQAVQRHPAPAAGLPAPRRVSAAAKLGQSAPRRGCWAKVHAEHPQHLHHQRATAPSPSPARPRPSSAAVRCPPAPREPPSAVPSRWLPFRSPRPIARRAPRTPSGTGG